MNTLDFRESMDNGLSFELLIDGTPLGDLVGGERGGFPYWLVDGDLPRWGEDASSGRRIVCVCECGEYGCGHTSCLVELKGEVVRFREFEGAASKPGKLFVVSVMKYRSVVSAIVARANARREADHPLEG